MQKFIIFDLDGTVLDTLESIYLSCNQYLKNHNYPYQYTKDEIQSFIGRGIINLFKQVIKSEEYTKEQIDEFIELFNKYQKDAKPYNKVKETLESLHALGYKLFVFSNKADPLVKDIQNNQFKGFAFDGCFGHILSYNPKPDVTLLNKQIIDKYNLDPKDGFYVGDSEVDYQTAINAKLKPILVTYGYGKIKTIDCVKIDSFDKLIECSR